MKLNELSAALFTAGVWKLIAVTTVKICFAECGFPVDHVYNNDNSVLKHTENEENDCNNLQLTRSQFEDKTYDSALMVCGIHSINQVLDQEEEEEDMVTFLNALKEVEVARK